MAELQQWKKRALRAEAALKAMVDADPESPSHNKRVKLDTTARTEIPKATGVTGGTSRAPVFSHGTCGPTPKSLPYARFPHGVPGPRTPPMDRIGEQKDNVIVANPRGVTARSFQPPPPPPPPPPAVTPHMLYPRRPRAGWQVAMRKAIAAVVSGANNSTSSSSSSSSSSQVGINGNISTTDGGDNDVYE